MVADSLINNNITMIKGPAGSGKSTLALGYLFHLLDKGKISKIIVFCNTVATKNAAKLGFYPGSREEKLLDSQIGNFLSSKLGGKMEVERLIDDEKLFLKNPEMANDENLAAQIMCFGMAQGWFTGKKLAHYFSGSLKNYKGARNIINGVDKADLIASYANIFETALRLAV